MKSWIIALPRPDLSRCIDIGCFGKEKNADRISEVTAGDGIACYALKESRIIALGRVTRGYYHDSSSKFLKEGEFAHRFDFSANYLGDNEIDVSKLTLTSVPKGGNFGLLVKSGFRILTLEDWNLFCESGGLDELKIEVPQSSQRQSWWVNQNKTFGQERAGGFIWAPQKGKIGQEVFHHINVSKVRAGDFIYHYADGRIKSLSVATSDAVSADKPQDLPADLWEKNGFLARVEYHDLEVPVALNDIPIEIRIEASGDRSPFTKSGSVNQGYLFALPESFTSRLSLLFPQLDFSNIEIHSNEDLETLLNQIRGLRVDRQDGVPRLYKPAILWAVIEALTDGSLKDNEIEFDWLIPRFSSILSRCKQSAGEKQAAAGFFHLASEPLWELVLRSPNNPPQRGEPAQIRNHVKYAALPEQYWSLLQNGENRQIVEKTLVRYWFAPYLNKHAMNSDFNYASETKQLIDAIAATGFRFEPWQIACYVTAMRTKPFLILAGVSGSGKSRLPQLIASATGGISELFPVKPDWTDSSDVLGYIQLQGELKPGPLLTLARKAQESDDSHHVCIVDEMNLARVEHYFAEILSRIEEARENDGHSKRLFSQDLSAKDSHWQNVGLSPKLAIVGTVNMDESTHDFSRKVLDRAFTLEFSEIDLTVWEELSVSSSAGSGSHWPSAAWQPKATRLSKLTNIDEVTREKINSVIQVLVELNRFLVHARLQIAYRSRDEIVLFVLHADDVIDSFVTSTGEPVDPLDLALQMKVLPRIAGGSDAIRRLILQLLGWSWSKTPFKESDESKDLLEEWSSLGRPLSIPGARFPRTCARLCLMWDRVLHEDYTSFWL